MGHEPLESRYDVVIAGARCAGASTALLLAREGLKVLVVDPVPAGRDTLSTHALMRGAVLQLHRWGLLDRVRAAGTPPLPVTTFDYGDEVVSIPIKPKEGVDALFAPRRTVLDPILRDAARDAGARVVHGRALTALSRDGSGRVTGALLGGAGTEAQWVEADLVVGADGVRSTVADLVHAPILRRARHATASVYGYWRGLERGGTRWYFRPGVGMGVIPTNGGAACVFASVRPEVLRAVGGAGLEALLLESARCVDPELACRLGPENRDGGLRGFAGIPGHLRRARGPGWALVGDAGYFRDPLTAHGISDALRDAELLASAVLAGSDTALDGYQEARDEAAMGVMEVTDAIASLAWTMDEVKALHHRLSREMSVAVEVLRRRAAA